MYELQFPYTKDMMEIVWKNFGFSDAINFLLKNKLKPKHQTNYKRV